MTDSARKSKIPQFTDKLRFSDRNKIAAWSADDAKNLADIDNFTTLRYT
jgi:hypothetical protein